MRAVLAACQCQPKLVSLFRRGKIEYWLTPLPVHPFFALRDSLSLKSFEDVACLVQKKKRCSN